MTPNDRDRIEIRALRVVGTHGLLAEERGRGQPFEIDLDVDADLTKAGRSDSLDDTVDYGAVVERTVAVVAGRSYSLLEALAEAIASAVLVDHRVTSVSVAVRKVRPPLPADLGSVGVRITRSRA